MDKRRLTITFIALLCLFQSGCAVLTLPVKVATTALDIVGNVISGTFKLLQKAPIPLPT